MQGTGLPSGSPWAGRRWRRAGHYETLDPARPHPSADGGTGSGGAPTFRGGQSGFARRIPAPQCRPARKPLCARRDSPPPAPRDAGRPGTLMRTLPVRVFWQTTRSTWSTAPGRRPGCHPALPAAGGTGPWQAGVRFKGLPDGPSWGMNAYSQIAGCVNRALGGSPSQVGLQSRTSTVKNHGTSVRIRQARLVQLVGVAVQAAALLAGRPEEVGGQVLLAGFQHVHRSLSRLPHQRVQPAVALDAQHDQRRDEGALGEPVSPSRRSTARRHAPRGGPPGRRGPSSRGLSRAAKAPPPEGVTALDI